MSSEETPLPTNLKSRQEHVRRFTLVYCGVCLAFSAYFTPQGFNPATAVPVNVLLFLIGAPYWFRNARVSPTLLNAVSQVSNALAFVWICSFLGPTSHVNLVAIPQFLLVLMMFAGVNRPLSWIFGAMCIVQLTLPLFPFVDTWYLHKRMPEPALVVLRQFFDFTVLGLSTYQFRVIARAWRDAVALVEEEKRKLAEESAWRLRVLKILGHDVKDPANLALQLVRRIRKEAKGSVDVEFLEQVEQSQLLVREIIQNVESYALSHAELPQERAWCDVPGALARLSPWLTLRLEERSIRIDASGSRDEHRLWVVPEAFVFQVLANLVANSIRHSPSGSVLSLSTEQDQAGTRWILRDQGPGFAEPDEASEGEAKGMGIRIAKTFAKLQGLRIEWRNARESDSSPWGTEVVIAQAPILDEF